MEREGRREFSFTAQPLAWQNLHLFSFKHRGSVSFHFCEETVMECACVCVCFCLYEGSAGLCGSLSGACALMNVWLSIYDFINT